MPGYVVPALPDAARGLAVLRREDMERRSLRVGRQRAGPSCKREAAVDKRGPETPLRDQYPRQCHDGVA